MTISVVILFPGWVDIYEIGELFIDCKGPIEVEYIYFNHEIEKIVVYYGKVVNVNHISYLRSITNNRNSVS